jgi:pyrimidine-nucleoside phosphorylase
MRPYDIIVAKRDGRELRAEEIDAFIQGVTAAAIPDYQIAAWLMAVYLQSMSARETRDLTLAMRDSGERVDLTEIATAHGCPALDKHSTGGVGDKTTLVVVPILAAAGVPILKMSGRGLGFSGGTVDKLEAIPGFRTDLAIDEAKAQVRRIGAALIAQTEALAPADKFLYGLRDVTATVESMPLIASSIMCKKLAAGAQRIVLDVKVGRGAFMKTRADAEELARTLVEIGTGAGVPTVALLTAMDEPLGRMVGNALEIREAVRTLRAASEAEPRFRALCVELAVHGLLAVGKASDPDGARTIVETLLNSGAALAKFEEIIAAQGGPVGVQAIEAALPQAPVTHIVGSAKRGAVIELDAAEIGRLAMRLGAGRIAKGDLIDPAVGIELHAKMGDHVAVGQPLATLHLCAQDASQADLFAGELCAAFNLGEPSAGLSFTADLILGVVRWPF